MNQVMPNGVFCTKQLEMGLSQKSVAAAGADLEGGCKGVRTSPPSPPPRDDLRFSNTAGILQKKKKVCGLLVLK